MDKQSALNRASALKERDDMYQDPSELSTRSKRIQAYLHGSDVTDEMDEPGHFLSFASTAVPGQRDIFNQVHTNPIRSKLAALAAGAYEHENSSPARSGELQELAQARYREYDQAGSFRRSVHLELEKNISPGLLSRLNAADGLLTRILCQECPLKSDQKHLGLLLEIVAQSIERMSFGTERSQEQIRAVWLMQATKLLQIFVYQMQQMNADLSTSQSLQEEEMRCDASRCLSTSDLSLSHGTCSSLSSETEVSGKDQASESNTHNDDLKATVKNACRHAVKTLESVCVSSVRLDDASAEYHGINLVDTRKLELTLTSLYLEMVEWKANEVKVFGNDVEVIQGLSSLLKDAYDKQLAALNSIKKAESYTLPMDGQLDLDTARFEMRKLCNEGRVIEQNLLHIKSMYRKVFSALTSERVPFAMVKDHIRLGWPNVSSHLGQLNLRLIRWKAELLRLESVTDYISQGKRASGESMIWFQGMRRHTYQPAGASFPDEAEGMRSSFEHPLVASNLASLQHSICGAQREAFLSSFPPLVQQRTRSKPSAREMNQPIDSSAAGKESQTSAQRTSTTTGSVIRTRQPGDYMEVTGDGVQSLGSKSEASEAFSFL